MSNRIERFALRVIAAACCGCLLVFAAVNPPNAFGQVAGGQDGLVAGGRHGQEKEAPSRETIEESPITSFDRDHWSFRPLNRPALPHETGNHAWIRTDIDRFIHFRLRSANLAPAPPADRVTLIRRATFDLTGLPPTPAEIDEFVSDPVPDAYERLIDRLLASPRYGEHQAQMWLDLARFAETDGFEHDKVRPNAWRYRDWVVESFDAGMPFDRFVELQLAADELTPADKESAVATAFCLSGPDMPDINSQVERRHNLLNELTATVGSVFLGLQIGCAQCHDHKYDPVSQADFYRLKAVFEPAVHVKKNQSVYLLREPMGAAAPSHLLIRGDWRRLGPIVRPGFPRIAGGPTFGEQRRRIALPGGVRGRRSALATWLTRPDHPLTPRVLANRLWQQHFGVGLSSTPSDFGVIGEAPSHPHLLDWLAVELVRRDWDLKPIHRLIVTSAVYRQSSRLPPNTAPAQVQQNWLRAVQVDPQNKLLWRFSRRRLSGEALRDAMLAASSWLDYRRGGPGVRPPLPPELVKTLLKNQWNVSPRRADHFRRSVYIFARRNLRYPIFDAFDRPDANASCPQRSRTTTAPQSLLLLNSEFTRDAARRLASLVLSSCQTNEAQITLCFRRALGRAPDPEELTSAKAFLQKQTDFLQTEKGSVGPWVRTSIGLLKPTDSQTHRLTDLQTAALTDLCVALFNANEFLYVD